MLSSLECDLVEGILKDILIKAIVTHEFLHAALAYSHSVKDFEEFLEFVLLDVLSVDSKNDLLSTGILCEVD